MKRLDAIEQLSNVQLNIESTERRIQSIKTSPYYNVWTFGGGESRRQHDLEIQEKCLTYWKRRFNRIINQIIY